MPRFRYTKEMIRWLTANANGKHTEIVTLEFNEAFSQSKTRSQIRACLKNNGIVTGYLKNSHPDRKYRSFTNEQADWIRTEYRDISVQELTDRFNARFDCQKSFNQIRAFTKNNKITSGRTGQFVKGQKGWNTGTKGLTGANSGSFKKGQEPHNTKHLGHERTTKDGYIEISVNQKNPHTGYHRRYVLKHRWVWEQENGPIPKSHCLKFLDSNRENCSLDNLELIPRSLLPRLKWKGYDTAPVDLKPLIMTTAKLAAKAKELST